MRNEFDKISGYTEEKEELIKIAKLINNYSKFRDAGGRLGKGILLVGPSGVGKTSLAKALLNEANCNSVSISLNDVDSEDDFPNYVKSQFEKASKDLPCIVYIDELDKMVGQQSPFFTNTNNATKNSIIINEINKYSKLNGLFLLLVANDRYTLDKTFVRSGRVDKIIEFNRPNEKERKEILSYYLKSKKVNDDVDIMKVAKITNGLSGADIESLINNAVINTFVEDKKTISMKDIMKAYYDIVFKTSNKELNIDEENIRMLASHEAAHLTLSLLTNPDSVTFASILPRGNALGFVQTNPDEITSCSKEELFNEIVCALGGRAAEEMFFNKLTGGCSSDIVYAKSTACKMIRFLGMYGLDLLEGYQVSGEFYSGKSSNDKLLKVEKKEDEIIDEAYSLSKQLILKNKKLFDTCTIELLKKKNLYKEDIEDIISKFNLKGLSSGEFEEVKYHDHLNILNLEKDYSFGLYKATQIYSKLINQKLENLN